MKIAAAALLSVLCSVPARAGTYAVVIGNNAPPADADESLAPLRYADDDAVRFLGLLRATGARVELLSVLDDRTQRRHPQAAPEARVPSLENLRRVMDSLREAMDRDRLRGEEVRFFFVYSGHGARAKSGRAFLTLDDGPLTEEILFDELLRDLPAKYVHLIVDACNASGAVGVRGPFDREIDARAVPVTAEDLAGLSRLERLPNVGVLLASTEGKASHEWTEVEAGVFTHEVLSALGGAADVNGDRLIEYSEVQAFVSSANRDLGDPRAVPDVVARPPKINHRAVLADLRTLQQFTLLQGSPAGLGRFYVELDNGLRAMDAHLAGDLDVTLALPGQGLAFLRSARGEATLRLRQGTVLPLGRLTFEDLPTARRGSIEQTFHRRLFASAYGADYYRGFVDRVGGVPVDFGGVPSMSQPRRGSRGLSRSLLVASGALLVTSGVATWIAVDARRDHEATSLERSARAHARRYETATTIAIGSAVLAAVAGAGAWYYRPHVEAGGPGRPTTIGVSGRF